MTGEQVAGITAFIVLLLSIAGIAYEIFTAGSHEPKDDTPYLDREAYSNLALEIMRPRLGFPSEIMPNGHDIGWAEESLPKARVFVATVEPPALRRACEKWVRHSEYCIASAKSALALQTRTNELRDKYLKDARP